MIIGETMENLIKQGYLCNYRAFAHPNASRFNNRQKDGRGLQQRGN